MRQHAVVVQGLGPDRRVDDLDGDIGIFKKPAVEIFSPKKDDANAVGTRDRPDRSLPYANPPSFRRKAEAGKIPADEGVLLRNGQIRH
jgi:hypothetical protein